MIKGEMSIEHESNHLVIPDAFIIDRLTDQNFDIYNGVPLRLPENNPIDEILPTSIDNSQVIIIELKADDT